MSEWYYSKDGAQIGPVKEADLKALLGNGTLDASSTLVWKAGMTDWVPAAQVPDLLNAPSAATRSDDTPLHSSDGEANSSQFALPEIPPGSQSIDAIACVKRGLDLAVRHLGLVLLVTVVYLAITIGVEIALSSMDAALGWGQSEVIATEDGESIILPATSSLLNVVLSYLASIFLSLGVARFSLNLVSGQKASVADLFGELRLLARGVVATLLFTIASTLGFILLIVPGFYIVARFGLFLTAIVDRNCGIMEAFQYSSRITTDNRLNMVAICFLSFGIALIGLLMLVVGLVFAIPVIMLTWAVAYRWLQYGHQAAMDHPRTKTPMLAPLP